VQSFQKPGLQEAWEMIVQNTIPTGLRLFAAVFATTATIILTSPVVAAQGTTATGSIDAVATANKAATARSKAAHAAGAYYIEFRSRYAQSYGHTFAMFGRLNARGQIVEREVAGLHPAGDSPVPWMIGHLVFVPSETGPSDGDLEEKYVSARYRVVLSESEYQRVTTHIKELQASSPVWHAVTYNCNAFVADIAKFMGLQTPSSTLLYPADFINSMRELNKG
jgi:hypothetical protein